MKYPLVDVSEVKNTKDRILLTAIKMFAERGYAAVSVRDIADQVNIKPASLYNHFPSKEALFDSIIDTIKNVYMEYYDRVEKRAEQAASFEDVLELLFAELKEVYHMFVYYGVSLIATEQFRNQKARHAFDEVYMKMGIDYTAKAFDDCVKKGWVKEFDTRTLAILVMNSVFAGSLVRVQQDLGHKTVYDAAQMFTSIQQYILDSLEIIK